MFERNVARNLAAARLDTPVVLLSGPRQVGKSTLARRAAETSPGEPITLAGPPKTADRSRYFTLDDATTLEAISEDPESWLENFKSDNWTVIDEVQRFPNLLTAIKRDVDLDRRPNRYLLTGSSNVMAIPRIAESLAGRMEILNLWPLAQNEIENVRPTFLDTIFSTSKLNWQSVYTRQQVIERAFLGGYPDAITRQTRSRRNAWFGSYITTVVQREIKSISDIENDGAVVRILRALASRSGQPRNIEALSQATGIPATTITRHIELLKATFLIIEILPWSGGIDARITRSPKIIINDSGLYAYLLNVTDTDTKIGFLVETFVGAELLKAASFHGIGEFTLFHYRTHRQFEVDFVVEFGDRRIVGFEVKASRSVTSEDFRGLRALSELAGNRFHRGIVFYCGSDCVPFAQNLWAVPIPALWI